MRKMDLYWSGAFSSIILDVSGKRLFCYETDKDELHQRYGGKCFYRSQSGLSGKGYITDNIDGLIELGSYRRCGDVSKIKCTDTDELYCYVPTLGHAGIDYNNKIPTVITNGKAVIFVSTYGSDIIDAIINFNKITDSGVDKFESGYIDGGEIKRKEIKISNFRVGGYNDEITVNLFMYSRYSDAPKGGIDILLFIDKQSHNIEESLETGELQFSNSPVHSALGAYFCPEQAWGGEKCWLRLGPYGFFDYKWANDPREIIGDLGGGWHGEGNGLIWKRKGLNIYALQDRECEHWWEEFEIEVSVFEWFSKNIEDWREHLNTRIDNKIEKKTFYQAFKNKKLEEIKEVLISHHDHVISIELARSIGMCEPGISTFIKKYELEGEEIRIGKIVQHPQFQEMLKNKDFVAVLAAAIKIKVND